MEKNAGKQNARKQHLSRTHLSVRAKKNLNFKCYLPALGIEPRPLRQQAETLTITPATVYHNARKQWVHSKRCKLE